jgi:hypothetical protein
MGKAKGWRLILAGANGGNSDEKTAGKHREQIEEKTLNRSPCGYQAIANPEIVPGIERHQSGVADDSEYSPDHHGVLAHCIFSSSKGNCCLFFSTFKKVLAHAPRHKVWNIYIVCQRFL